MRVLSLPTYVELVPSPKHPAGELLYTCDINRATKFGGLDVRHGPPKLIVIPEALDSPSESRHVPPPREREEFTVHREERFMKKRFSGWSA